MGLNWFPMKIIPSDNDIGILGAKIMYATPDCGNSKLTWWRFLTIRCKISGVKRRLYMMIGNKISFCRKKAGMSQEALATKLNISRQAVSRWEMGQAVPDTEKIIQLSKLFHVSTDYLLMDEIEESLAEENPPNIQTDSTKEKRRHLRIYCGKCLLTVGLVALAVTLIGAGVYSNTLNEWYTAWGTYGTALFRTWIIVPLIFSFCVAVIGIIILWNEYLSED